MTIDTGRVPSEPGSREPSPMVSALTGFDPSRYEGKPRWLPKAEKLLLRALLDAVEERMAMMTDREQDVVLAACLDVSPINCAWDEYAIAGIVYHSLSHDVANRDSDGSGVASETGTGSTEGNSAAPQGIAPAVSHLTDQEGQNQ